MLAADFTSKGGLGNGLPLLSLSLNGAKSSKYCTKTKEKHNPKKKKVYKISVCIKRYM
jgi:hypothetical protein